jgi:hypothetical protein
MNLCLHITQNLYKGFLGFMYNLSAVCNGQIYYLCNIYNSFNGSGICVLYYYVLFQIIWASDGLTDPRNVKNMYVCMYVRVSLCIYMHVYATWTGRAECTYV